MLNELSQIQGQDQDKSQGGAEPSTVQHNEVPMTVPKVANETAHEAATEQVRKYLKAGWALVPIGRGLKGPKTAGWQIQEKCFSVGCSDGAVERLARGNIGLAHAYCEPTPTCAIDIDAFKPAKIWLRGRGIDLLGLLYAPDAVVIHSGKRGSLKLLYRLPKGVGLLESKKITAPEGQTELEFRCATKDGKTVQDVLPPSLHPGGALYQWMGEGNPTDMPEIPAALLEVWQELICLQKPRGSRSGAGSGVSEALRAKYNREETPRQVAIIQEGLSFIKADCARDIWRDIVWGVLSTGWNCAQELAREWSMTAPEAYDEAAFCRLVHSYLDDRATPLTLGTVYHHARRGGWHGRY